MVLSRYGIFIWLALLTLLAVGFVSRQQAEIQQIGAALADADRFWLAGIVVAQLVALVLSGLTYKVILRRLGHHVRLHQVLRAVILASPTAKDFVESFAPGNSAKAREAVASNTPAADKDSALRLLQNARELLYADYGKRIKNATEPRKTYDWLSNPESYRYIRLLYQQGRILPLKGNLLTDKIMPSIGKAARALDVPIRNFYT